MGGQPPPVGAAPPNMGPIPPPLSLGQIEIISGDLYIRRPPNFYRNSSCIFWTRQTHFWCSLRLRWSCSDDLIGIAGARA